MTCPPLLERTRPGANGTDAAVAPVRRWSSAARSLHRRLSKDDAGAQFARYVTVGAVSSVVYALLFVVLEPLGDQPANLAGAVASTLLANELHRRLTFHAGGSVSWFTAQWEGGGLAGVGLVATSLALAGVHALVGDIGTGPQLCLIAAVTGLIGLVRFVALRSWVFSDRSFSDRHA